MKSAVKQSIILLFMGMFVLSSCTREEAIQDPEEAFKLSTRGGSIDTKQMTIEFYEHVTDERREFLRDFYTRKGILKGHKKCEDDPKVEVWDVLCPGCRSDDDLPIKTSDCPDDSTTERAPSSDTDPDPSEDCDIRKRTIGIWCDL